MKTPLPLLVATLSTALFAMVALFATTVVVTACSGNLDVGTNPASDAAPPRGNPDAGNPTRSGFSSPYPDAPPPYTPDPRGVAEGVGGTLDGAPFNVQGALVYHGTLSDGQPGLRIMFSSSPSGMKCDLFSAVSNSKTVRIDLPTGNDAATSTAFDAESFMYLDAMDATCESSPTHPTAAKITLYPVDAGSVAGLVVATFPTGDVSGSFIIPLCDAEPATAEWCL